MGNFKVRRLTANCSVFSLFALIVLLSGCASVYKSPDLASYVSEHSKIAVIPFDLAFDPDYKTDEESREKLESQQGSIVHRTVYVRLFGNQQRDHYTVEVLDINETDSLLNQSLGRHATHDELVAEMTTTEICKILHVDAVVTGDMTLRLPFGYGGSLASGLKAGLFGKAQMASISMAILECADGELIWKYEHTANGGVPSYPESASRAVIDGAARAFPYRRSK